MTNNSGAPLHMSQAIQGSGFHQPLDCRLVRGSKSVISPVRRSCFPVSSVTCTLRCSRGVISDLRTLVYLQYLVKIQCTVEMVFYLDYIRHRRDW